MSLPVTRTRSSTITRPERVSRDVVICPGCECWRRDWRQPPLGLEPLAEFHLPRASVGHSGGQSQWWLAGGAVNWLLYPQFGAGSGVAIVCHYRPVRGFDHLLHLLA